ncbi:MAG: tetratricopeptide repeat protein, partial [Candidatus Saccharicenans sp.]|nr:tetratricopeptide repeat protein [Candidatus Saccharicenans sp.]
MPQASERYFQCLELARKLGDAAAVEYCQKTIEIIDLFNKAKDLRQYKKYSEAIEVLDRAIAICNAIRNDTLKMKCLRRKSLCLLDTNDSENYLKANLEANGIAKKLKNSYEIIITLNNIGHWYFINNNLTLAVDYFTQAISYINEDTQPQDIFDIYYNLGTVYNEIGNFNKSIEYFSNALNLISQDKTNPYYSATLNNLGFGYIKKGLANGSREDYDRAFEYFSQAQAIAAESGNKNYQVAFLNNLGSLKAHLEENLDAL